MNTGEQGNTTPGTPGNSPGQLFYGLRREQVTDGQDGLSSALLFFARIYVRKGLFKPDKGTCTAQRILGMAFFPGHGEGQGIYPGRDQDVSHFSVYYSAITGQTDPPAGLPDQGNEIGQLRIEQGFSPALQMQDRTPGQDLEQ